MENQRKIANFFFKMVEDIYAMFGDYCATLWDVTNAASRLKDYIDIPKDNKTLIDIARNVGLTEEKAIDANTVRMSKPSKILFGLFEGKK